MLYICIDNQISCNVRSFKPPFDVRYISSVACVKKKRETPETKKKKQSNGNLTEGAKNVLHKMNEKK